MENFANLLSDPEHFETSTFKGVESTMLMVEMPFAQKLAMHLIKEDKRRFSTGKGLSDKIKIYIINSHT